MTSHLDINREALRKATTILNKVYNVAMNFESILPLDQIVGFVNGVVISDSRYWSSRNAMTL
jgi:hypothetical protein